MFITFDIHSKLFLSQISSNINLQLLTEFYIIEISSFAGNIYRSWDCPGSQEFVQSMISYPLIKQH